jgi:hypothetical protein
MNEDRAINWDMVQGSGNGGQFGALICLPIAAQGF